MAAAHFGDASRRFGRLTQPIYELLVVDDGSTDDSAEVATEFGARLITTYHLPLTTSHSLGPASARNAGARAAHGEVLFFVDSDVAVRPDSVGKVIRAFRDDPDLVAAFGSYDEQPTDPGFISQYKNLFHHYVHQHAREEASTFWAGCGAIRRSVFLAVGGFDEANYRRPSIEDIDLGYRLARRGAKIRLFRIGR